LLTVLVISLTAAVASVAGGAAAFVREPTTLAMSVALGFASGVLLGAVTLEMLPRAHELSSLGATAAGFSAGFLAMWLFDLYVNAGYVAGDRAAEYPQVIARHRRRRPRGDEVAVLAGGTSLEELVEGFAIGTGVVIDPDLGALIAAAIAIDNLSEGLSIGELVVSKSGRTRAAARRALGWTALIGVSLVSAAALGWLLLRDADDSVVGILLAGGGGGMLYLTVTALIPPSEARQYEGSGALATGAGLLTILFLTGTA
jgi:zinc transporter, ZIP family